MSDTVENIQQDLGKLNVENASNSDPMVKSEVSTTDNSSSGPVVVAKEKKPKVKKPKAPPVKKRPFGDDAGFIEIDVSTLKYEHDTFLPEPVVDEETKYTNSVTNTDSDIANAHNDNERRLRTIARDTGLTSSVFFRAPSCYYERAIEWRRALLNAPSPHYLCKSMVMHNSKCAHDSFTDRRDSKYYLVVVQYTARLHNERLGKAVRSLSDPPPGRSAFNFRVCPTEVNDQLTGYSHNGVTPLGTRERIPVVLSDRIAKLEHGFFWLGAGEVNLKWRVSVQDFMRHFDPIVANITYDGTIDPDQGPEAAAASAAEQ